MFKGPHNNFHIVAFSKLEKVFLRKNRVPTVMENHGKSWKKKWSWKVMENSKNSECHGNLFARKKKSWKSHGNQLSKSA